MGSCYSKGISDSVKRNKNHNRQKMFRFGISFGRNDLNVEGHLQMGYNSKTIKNYGPLREHPMVQNDNVSSEIVSEEELKTQELKDSS